MDGERSLILGEEVFSKKPCPPTLSVDVVSAQARFFMDTEWAPAGFECLVSFPLRAVKP